MSRNTDLVVHEYEPVDSHRKPIPHEQHLVYASWLGMSLTCGNRSEKRSRDRTGRVVIESFFWVYFSRGLAPILKHLRQIRPRSDNDTKDKVRYIGPGIRGCRDRDTKARKSKLRILDRSNNPRRPRSRSQLTTMNA